MKLKLQLPKIFRRKKTALRKHESQPVLCTKKTTVIPLRRSRSSGSVDFAPAPRVKSFTTNHGVSLEPFILPPSAPIRLTLLPTTLVRENYRQSFTSVTRKRITRGCQSFVRKMYHPRSLPNPPKRHSDTTLMNGTFRRSLPELSSNSVML